MPQPVRPPPMNKPTSLTEQRSRCACFVDTPTMWTRPTRRRSRHLFQSLYLPPGPSVDQLRRIASHVRVEIGLQSSEGVFIDEIRFK